MPDAQLKQDILGLSDVLKSLRDEVKELREQRAGESNNSHSSIKIDTGGATAWFSGRVASYCCAIMLGLSLGLSALAVVTWVKVGNVESSANANKAYLSAIFQRNPELKRDIDKEKKK